MGVMDAAGDRAAAAGAVGTEHGGMLARLAALPEVMRYVADGGAVAGGAGGGAVGPDARALARPTASAGAPRSSAGPGAPSG